MLEAGIKGLVLRTLWLYGYIPGARRNLVTWPLEVLARGEKMEVVDDQWGNPAYVHDLAQFVLELCQRDIKGLFHMGGSTYMTRHELTLELVRFFGFDENLVKPISTDAAAQQARRPLKSGLRTEILRTTLGRMPLGFNEGLERMVREEEFHRDFAYLGYWTGS